MNGRGLNAGKNTFSLIRPIKAFFPSEHLVRVQTDKSNASKPLLVFIESVLGTRLPSFVTSGSVGERAETEFLGFQTDLVRHLNLRLSS